MVRVKVEGSTYVLLGSLVLFGPVHRQLLPQCLLAIQCSLSLLCFLEMGRWGKKKEGCMKRGEQDEK